MNIGVYCAVCSNVVVEKATGALLCSELMRHREPVWLVFFFEAVFERRVVWQRRGTRGNGPVLSASRSTVVPATNEERRVACQVARCRKRAWQVGIMDVFCTLRRHGQPSGYYRGMCCRWYPRHCIHRRGSARVRNFLPETSNFVT